MMKKYILDNWTRVAWLVLQLPIFIVFGYVTPPNVVTPLLLLLIGLSSGIELTSLIVNYKKKV